MKSEKKINPETVSEGITRYFTLDGKEVTKEEYYRVYQKEAASTATLIIQEKKLAYRSADSDVYHIFDDCTVGNNIEPDKRIEGSGGKRLCQVCKARKKEG